VASDGTVGDSFGTSLTLRGDVLVVGAAFDDDLGASSGSAYVLRRDGSSWNEEAKLLAFDGTADDELGHSVAADGEAMIVGSWLADGPSTVNSGAAYVFKQTLASGPLLAVKLVSDDPGWSDTFGNAVDISGDCAVVGAVNENSLGLDNPGATYVFCDLPGVDDPRLHAHVDIICCEQPPDPAGPVIGTLHIFTRLGRSITFERWIDLREPSGRTSTVLPRATVTIPASRTGYVERFRLTAERARGSELIAYWKDPSGVTHIEKPVAVQLR